MPNNIAQPNTLQPSRLEQFILHAIFLGFFIMAFLYYKERLFSDAAYYLFHTINHQFFRVDHQRFVLIIPELLPLIAVYMGLGMKTILILYSLSYVIFYYVLFNIACYGLKDRAACIILVMLQAVGISYLYFSPMLEICYGIALAILFYTLLRNGKYKTTPQVVLLMILELFILFSHPENFIVFLFIVLFDILESGYKKKLHLLFVGLMLACMVFKLFTFSDYEQAKVTNAANFGYSQSYLNLLHFDYIVILVKMLAKHYLEIHLLLLGVCICYLIQKNVKKLALLLFIYVGIIVLLNSTTSANNFSRYNESMYSPIIPVICIAFMYDVFATRRGHWRTALFGLLIIFILLKVNLIIEKGRQLFSPRVAQLERLIQYAQQLDGNKFIVDHVNIGTEYSMTGWSHPMETMLLSAATPSGKLVSLATYEDLDYDHNAEKLTPANFMLRRFEVEPLSILNTRYFKIAEGDYCYLNTPSTFATIDSTSLVSSVSLRAPNHLEAAKNEYLYIPLTLTIIKCYTLHSSKQDSLYVSYRWVGDGKEVDTERSTTLPEVDILTSYTQTMAVKAPAQEGHYVLELGFLVKNKWLKTGTKVEAVIKE